MKLDSILEGINFDAIKRESGYYDTFLPINLTWLDGIVHFLRYENPTPQSKRFADKVESFFNSKYGNMVYHKKDDAKISNIINNNWKALSANNTLDQIKKQIIFTNKALQSFVHSGVIAREGRHEEETDFWLDQQNKDRYMRGDY